MAYGGGGRGDGAVGGGPGRGAAAGGGGEGAPPYRPTGVVWPPPPPPGSTPVTIRTPPPSTSPSPSPNQPAPQAAAASSSSTSTPSTAVLVKLVKQKAMEIARAPPAAVAAAVAAASPDGEALASDNLAQVSKEEVVHSARGYGVTRNNISINSLFHYKVYIKYDKLRASKIEVLNELIKLYGNTSLDGKLPADDGDTTGSLCFELEEFVVKLIDPENKDKERAEREYKITIRIAGKTDLYHLHLFLLGRQRDMPQEAIHVHDVVLRESPSWNYVTVSRTLSTQFGHPGDIGWTEYYENLYKPQMALSLKIDISEISSFKPVTVIQFVEEFLNIRDVSRSLSNYDSTKTKTALGGVCIETNCHDDKIRRFSDDEDETRSCLPSGSESVPRYSRKLNDKKEIRIPSQCHKQRKQKNHEAVLHKCSTGSGAAITLFLIMMSLVCTVRGSSHGSDCNIAEYSNSIAQVCRFGAPPAICCDILLSAVHNCGNSTVLCDIGRSVAVKSSGFNVHDVMDWHRECTGKAESSMESASENASSICYVSDDMNTEDSVKEEGQQVNILVEPGDKEGNARQPTSTNLMFIGLGIGFGSATLFAFTLVVVWLFVRRRPLGPLVPQIGLPMIASHFSQEHLALPSQEHPHGPVPVLTPQEVTGQPAAVQPATNPMAYLASVISYAIVDRLTSRRRR